MHRITPQHSLGTRGGEVGGVGVEVNANGIPPQDYGHWAFITSKQFSEPTVSVTCKGTVTVHSHKLLPAESD